MGVRRVGPPVGPSDPQSVPRTGKTGFNEVLAQKRPLNNQKPDSLSGPLTNETRVKKEMAALIRGGGDSRQLVETALRNHPLVRDLPAKAREELIAQVSTTMNPMLKGRA